MTEGDSHNINHENCLLHSTVKNSVTQLRVGGCHVVSSRFVGTSHEKSKQQQ